MKDQNNLLGISTKKTHQQILRRNSTANAPTGSVNTGVLYTNVPLIDTLVDVVFSTSREFGDSLLVKSEGTLLISISFLTNNAAVDFGFTKNLPLPRYGTSTAQGLSQSVETARYVLYAGQGNGITQMSHGSVTVPVVAGDVINALINPVGSFNSSYNNLIVEFVPN